jgi:hypothetical protein
VRGGNLKRSPKRRYRVRKIWLLPIKTEYSTQPTSTCLYFSVSAICDSIFNESSKCVDALEDLMANFIYAVDFHLDRSRFFHREVSHL